MLVSMASLSIQSLSVGSCDITSLWHYFPNMLVAMVTLLRHSLSLSVGSYDVNHFCCDPCWSMRTNLESILWSGPTKWDYWAIDFSLYHKVFLCQGCEPKEREQHKTLINIISWFFFDLFVFGYVEDRDTGLSFRLPGGQSWTVYVEVKLT